MRVGVSLRSEWAARLDEARRRRHWSLSDAAKLAGVGKTTAHGWLTGDHFPTPALRPSYLKLVAALGLSDEVPDGIWDESAELGGGARTGSAPYVGLRAFGVADRELFHGRRDQVAALTAAVQDLRRTAGGGVLALLGPSGSGKSSLLAAGLIARECVDGALAGWGIAQLSAATLADSSPVDAELAVVDQFEEVFRLGEPACQDALSRLVELSRTMVVLIAMRSDVFGVASEHPELIDALSRPVLVAPMTREELAEAVTAPAELMGTRVEPELVDLVRNELAPRSTDSIPVDVLPLLSTALLQTWEYGRGRNMTVADYLAAGGVAHALDSQAEGVYTGLDADGQASVAKVFLQLVRVTESGAFARPLSLSTLSEDEARLLRPFVDARLLTSGDTWVRISHESLLTHWKRLDSWIQDRSADLRDLDRLRTATTIWRDASRSDDLLLPVERLGTFSDWPADPVRAPLLGPGERDYIEASRAHFTNAVAKERRGRRIALGLLSVAAALAIVAGGLFVRSEGFRTDAVAAKLDAESRQVAIAARSVRGQDANQEAQMALVANRLSTTLEARSALLDAASDDVPIRWLGKPSAVVAVNPAQDLAVRADGAGQVTMWRGDEVATSPGRTFAVAEATSPQYGVAVTRVAGRDLLAVGGASSAGLWDVTGDPVRLADFSRDQVTTYAAAFAADGDALAFGYSDGAVRLIRLDAAGRPAGSQDLQVNPSGTSSPAAVSAVAFDPAGRLWVGGVPDVIKRWQTGPQTARSLPDLAFRYGSAPVRAVSLAISPDGTQLAAATIANAVLRWHLHGEEATSAPPLTGFGSWVNAVSWSSDGARPLAGSSDQTVQVFAADSDTAATTLHTPALVTGAAAFGSRTLAVGSDGTLRVWTSPSPIVRASGASVYNLSTDATGAKWLAGGTLADGAMLWRLSGRDREPVPLTYPKLSGARSAAVAVAPDGSYLVAASKAGEVVVWPLTGSGAGAPTVSDSGLGYISCVTISPDSGLVAVMGYGGKKASILRAGPAGALTPLSQVDAVDAQMGIFTADSKALVIALAANSVDVWTGVDQASPAKASTITGFDTATIAITAAPAAQQIAVGEDSGHVSVWTLDDPAKPAKTHDFGDSHGSAYAVTFSTDGNTLAMASGDQKIWGWNLATSTTAFTLDGDLDRPWDVRYLAGGDTLVASGNNGRVRTWPSSVAQAHDQLCALRGDELTDREWGQYLPGIDRTDPCG